MSGKRCSQAGEQLVGMAESADRIEAVVLERVFQVIAKIGIVVQNGQIHQAAVASWFSLRLIGRRIGRSLGRGSYCQAVAPCRREADAGKVTSRQAPPSGSIGGCDGPAVLVNDALGDGEAQAGAFGVQAGGDERLENVRQHIGRDAGAIVFDGNGDPRLRVAIQTPRMNAISPDGGMAYRALRSRLTKTCTSRSELPVTRSFAST